MPDAKVGAHKLQNYFHILRTPLAYLEDHQLGTTGVASRIDMQRKKQVTENREALKPIIEMVIFCRARTNLPLWGKEHDPENYSTVSLTKPHHKDGKFIRALLQFRASSGDEKLKSHLLNSPRNATYVSAPIQNEILDICSKLF